MHPAVTVLEEYGLPYTLTLQVLQKYDLGQDVDSIIANLHQVDPNELSLSPFEEEMLKDTLENL